MNTTTALDLVNATLATVNATLKHTSYSATAHTAKDGVIVVENTCITVAGDDDAGSSAYAIQEESDRATTEALEAAGFTMIDAGPCDGGGSAYWSTWREEEGAAEARALGTAAGALFAHENPGEVLDPGATDWDATAWETDRAGFSAAQRAVLWPVYQAALVAETERLAR